MGFKTPDRFPGPLEEDRIEFYDQYGTMPDGDGHMMYSDGYFYARDMFGVFNLRSGQGGGLPPATQLGQVLYSIDGASFTVQLPLTSCHGWLINNDGELIVVG